MTRWIAGLAAGAAMMIATTAAQAAETLRFAVTDIVGVEMLQVEFGAFREKLEEVTGYTIEFNGRDGYLTAPDGVDEAVAGHFLAIMECGDIMGSGFVQGVVSNFGVSASATAGARSAIVVRREHEGLRRAMPQGGGPLPAPLMLRRGGRHGQRLPVCRPRVPAIQGHPP